MSGPLAEQIAYLLERSAFYREKLAGHDADGPLEALPLTTKQELRATVSPEHPFGTHCCVEPCRDRADLLHERHDGQAELHPAHRG